MKKRLLILHILFLVACCSFSQGIGIGTTTPDASAALDITHTAKGLLIPRMSTASINAITNPAKGLLVYDSLTNQLVVNMGTPATPNWQPIVSGSGLSLTGNGRISSGMPAAPSLQPVTDSAWSLTGNSGIDPGKQFIGTTDKQPLRFRINDTQAGELHPVTGNISWGLRAGQSNTTGFSNIAIGTDALKLNVTVSNLIAIGDSALFNNGLRDKNKFDGNFNIAIGSKSLFANTTGNSNTAIGNRSLNANTTGGHNTAIGFGSLQHNSIGRDNTAIGEFALSNTTGSNSNTAIGFFAGANFNLGFNNTLIGAFTTVNQNGLFNCVALGESAVCTGSSQVRLGNFATTSIGGVVGFSNLSDGRYKKNIQDGVKGIEFIMQLKPVTYQLKIADINTKINVGNGREQDERSKIAMAEKERTIFSGFVAQQVEQAAKDAGYDFSGLEKPTNENDFYGLRYAEFVVPLVKAVQEQQRMIDELKKINAGQKRSLEDCMNRLEKLEIALNITNKEIFVTEYPIISK